MSVKELKFNWPEYDCVVDIDISGNDIRFIVQQHGAISAFELDRNQAHLLMLYLQEHLGYNKIPVTEPKIWLCGCGKYHMKDFVCERIGK